MATKVMDANEAVALIAHKTNEVIAIYPITPSSNMGEHADEYSAAGEKNIFGAVPTVIEMQSEAGAAATTHGALQGGSLGTTFTASQGLLLMIPNMYKIAGELTSTVFHVSARSLAAQGLSIFGDHSDIMACRQIGFAMLGSCDSQEAHDMALISQAATLKGRIPILHFFDGFRTSHELSNVELISDDIIKAMIDLDLVNAHKARGLNPENPVIRGTSQNPDLYFQGRETVNKYYDEFSQIVQDEMDKFAKLTNRQYSNFEYYGDANADRVIVIMGSAAKTVKETIDALNADGYKVGMLMIRLYRPFSINNFMAKMPKSVKFVAVLDRSKEPGSAGEPVYLDVVNAFCEALDDGLIQSSPKIIGGRFGLSSKEFTPRMVKAVFDEFNKEKPKKRFTVGIIDDVTQLSLECDEDFYVKTPGATQAVFYGLGSDGTVGANKNSIKIIGDNSDLFVQAYFEYDSKKSGSLTTSHLRFSDKPINSTYLITHANFLAVHQFVFIEKYDLLKNAAPGASVLLNAPFDEAEVWDRLPRIAQKRIIDKGLKVYAINAYEIAKGCGLGVRINTIMQTCFFKISGVIKPDLAIEKIKGAIEHSYGKKGEAIVKMNFCGVDNAVAGLKQISVTPSVTSQRDLLSVYKLPVGADLFLQEVTTALSAFEGDSIPVSKVPADGTWPVGTTQFEKREISLDAPIWNADICIQCNKCVEWCPHAVIRTKICDKSEFDKAPQGFTFVESKGKYGENVYFTLQVSVEDCTGCALCVEICPAKDKTDLSKKAINMADIAPIHDTAVRDWEFFLDLPEFDRTKLGLDKVKDSQFLQPLFEFSGACPGCGETPYVKLMSQLFGDRMIIGNATGCSSIYGGNLPTTPWAKNKDGKGVAWSNSLFEDAAEFALGFRATVDQQQELAENLLKELREEIGGVLVDAVLNAEQKSEQGMIDQRARVAEIEKKLAQMSGDKVKILQGCVNQVIRKSVWALGGDGWAYDIGYGGLDHVVASGKNINILVLDTQVYSNTGGQSSKATPIGAVAKFAANGKRSNAKDLAMQMLGYENVYVARVAMGYNDTQTLKAFREADAYDGPSIIIAYSHCIAHGYNLRFGANQQKLAVESGLWPLFRYSPDLLNAGKAPFSLDYKEPTVAVKDYMYNETRFKMVNNMDPDEAKIFLTEADRYAKAQWARYSDLAATQNLTKSFNS